MEMKNNMTKKEYTKPSIRVVEWDFNEKVCQEASVMKNSFTQCINIERETGVNVVENRVSSGTWTRVGSN